MFESLSLPSLQELRSMAASMVPVALYPTLRTLIINALRLLPVPRHISFIMDGNRRYSRQHGITLPEGHWRGFEALKRTIELLLRLGVEHVTVYAFAIDNYKRGVGEVNYLMSMGKKALQDACERGELFDRFGVRMRMVGRVDLLPQDIQDLIAQVEALTAHNTRGTINIALSYSSLEEITSSITNTVKDTLETGEPESSINIDTLASKLYTTHTPPLDMLVRTSAVNRISDFFLWQLIINSSKYVNDPLNKSDKGSRDTILGAKYHIIPTLWPDIGMWDMVPIVLEWQAGEVSRRIARAIGLESPPIVC